MASTAAGTVAYAVITTDHQAWIQRLDLVQQTQAFAQWSVQIEQQNIDALIAKQSTCSSNAR